MDIIEKRTTYSFDRFLQARDQLDHLNNPFYIVFLTPTRKNIKFTKQKNESVLK